MVFNEVVQTTKDFMQDITVINPDWLRELAPDFYQFGTVRPYCGFLPSIENVRHTEDPFYNNIFCYQRFCCYKET